MNKKNYQKELDKVIGTLKDEERRPRLLLHSCCAPCSSYCLLYLREYFDITCYFYNPNISDVVEYFKRLSELERLVGEYNSEPGLRVGNVDPDLRVGNGESVLQAGNHDQILHVGNMESNLNARNQNDSDVANNNNVMAIRVLDGGFDSQNFFKSVKGLENIPEGGARCSECFSLRLDKTANAAKTGGFDYFTTTLTISPLKDEQLINQLGFDLADKYGISWLPTDFKKKGGYQESVKLSEKYGLYRQDYCGCDYSLRRDYDPSGKMGE